MQNQRYQQAKQVTLIGAAVNILLGFSKIIGGWLFHSHGLIADGIHSFSDLIVDIMVLFASKYGSQDADDSHPYGHQRIETAMTLMLAMMLILAGTGIAWDSLDEILFGTQTIPQLAAFPIALISIIANEILFHYTHIIGQRIHSALLLANAWHHRSDAAASLIVLCGILGSRFGFAILDPIAAIIVGALIIKMGINYAWNSVKELVDTAVEPQLLQQIQQLIAQVDGVQRLHQLRSRLMGKNILVDAHIIVAPDISVSEGHYIAQHVHQVLTQQIPHLKDVTIHVDAEDDEISSPSSDLPTRDFLEKTWLEGWRHDFPAITTYRLHYLNGHLILEIILSTAFTEWSALEQRIMTDLASQTIITEVYLLSQQKHLAILSADNTPPG